MTITQKVLNDTFCRLIPYSNGNVFTCEGFEELANWSEKQEWWHDFVELNSLGHYWRSSYRAEPYWFALTLFRFIMNSRLEERLRVNPGRDA